MSLEQDGEQLLLALMEGREDACRWKPDPTSGFFRARGDSYPTLAPDWLIDDGNLIIAGLRCCLSMFADGPHAVERAARSVEKTGRVLQGAVVDAGLHRLVVLVVCPPEDSKLAELEGYVHSGGDVRVMLFAEGGSTDAKAFARRVRPLECETFRLDEISEAEDAPAAAQILESVAVDEALFPFRATLVRGVRNALEDAEPTGQPWERAKAALQALTAKSIDGTESERDDD